MHMFQMILVKMCMPLNDGADKQIMLPDKCDSQIHFNTTIPITNYRG